MDTSAPPPLRPPALHFSFRFKLTLAMLGLIVGILGAVLYLTQRTLTEQYQQFLNAQFEQQVKIVQAQQQARFKAARDAIYPATQSVRVLAALSDEIYERSYSDFADALVEVMKQTYAEEMVDAVPSNGPFFRFLRLDSSVATPPDARSGSILGVSEKELDTALTKLASRENKLTVRSGYFPIQSAHGQLLYEILITPISDGEHLLSDLVFAAPVQSNDSVSAAAIRSGLLINGKLFSSTIPDTLLPQIQAAIDQPSKAASDEQVNLMVQGENLGFYYKKISQDYGFPPIYQISLISLADRDALSSSVRDVLLLALLASALVALILCIVVADRITARIYVLVEGIKKVATGQYDVTLSPRGSDEISLLTHNFNEMTAGLALKEKYRSVLDKVTDPQVAEEILQGKLVLGGENRDVTIMFCDIRGFTSLTADMPPAEVIEMLNEHMTALTTVIKTNKGVVDKFIGDAVMVIFGAPKSYGEDALNACRAASAMMAARENLNKSSRYRIRIGIGLASGEVVAGMMGSEDRLNYTVLGKQVNLSARLCSNAGPDEVVICPTTLARLQERFATTSKGALQLKGFSEPITAHLLGQERLPSVTS